MWLGLGGTLALAVVVAAVVTWLGLRALPDQAQHATVLPPEALTPPAGIEAPPNLTNLPHHTGMFVGRAGELARLADAVTASADVAGAGVVVLAVHGLGGVGKSTLAARYAATHQRDFSVIWWVTADSPAGIDTGLAALATALQPALAGLLPTEVLRERAVQWLASHDRWLVVLDNVTDPAHAQALLARAATGRLVITSRRATGWRGIATPVRLDVLAPGEARHLLAAILTHGGDPDPGRLAGADALCAELGYLPLAIEQAGAYIAETGTTPAAYLQLLAGYPVGMYQQTAEGGDAQRTIARIWRVTLDQLTGTPHAGQLLRILAFCAPDNIPRSLVDGLADPQPLLTAIGRLAAYSMITTEGDTLAVHRLVQAVTRTPDPADPHRSPAAVDEARDQAATLLGKAVPPTARDPAGWPTWRILLPHLEAIAQHTTPGTDTATTATLLGKTATFLEDQGALARAIPLFERGLATRTRMLGEDHPQTLVSRNDLAGAYQSAGDPGRAIPLFEATLDDRRRVLGNDHPDTLASRNNLAAAYRSAGDLGQAILLFEATLPVCARVLGEDHPDTLRSRNNLAGAYQSAGNLGRAIPLYEATVDGRRRVLGEDHPQTLVSRNNLAYAYQSAGDLGQAIPLYEATLAACARVLGEDHPDTLVSRNNLAYAYRSAGDLSRAIPLFEATVDCRRRVLGEDHLQTLVSRNNLAYTYQSAGDLSQAIPLFEATVAACARVLGEDHPQTLISRNNLAYTYQSAAGRAIRLFEATVAACARVRGEDHPQTLTLRNNLAHAYQSAGDLGRAIPLYKATLAACARGGLGDDHPLTMTVRGNLQRLTE